MLLGLGQTLSRASKIAVEVDQPPKPTVDLYFLCGQSNAHGHAVVSDLDANQVTQPGLFYSSWHEQTSNASSTQYYSNWASSTVAASTRGDNYTPTLGGSTLFGPEIGFMAKADAINLSGNNEIGIIKHAIGASSLTDDGSPDGGLSDWDLTATGDKRGDALRAMKLATADAITKLEALGYPWRFAGFIWWQGESGGTSADLIAFIDHIRSWLDVNYGLDMPKEEFPFVITNTSTYWQQGYDTEVAALRPHVGIVNTQSWAAPSWASRTLVHPGSNEYYPANATEVANGYNGNIGDSVGESDFDGDGVNDMFVIGEKYAEEMQLAINGNTTWKPDNIELWLDASDTNTTIFNGTNLVSISDKYSSGKIGGNAFNAFGNIVAGEVNGLQTLTFEDDSPTATGAVGGLGSDYIQSGNINPPLSGNNQIWYFVIKPKNVGTDDSGASQYDGMFMVGAKTYLTKLGWFFENNQLLNQTGVLPNNEVSILAIQMNWATNGNNGTTSCWIDGASVGAVNRLQDTGTNTPLATPASAVWKLMMYNSGQNFLEGEFCELIVSSKLSQREHIEAYLAQKWGIMDKLPMDHIYAPSAPPEPVWPQGFTWSTTTLGPNNETLSGDWVLDNNPAVGTWGYSHSVSAWGAILLDTVTNRWAYYDMYGYGPPLSSPDIILTDSSDITALTTARLSSGDSISNVT